MKITKALALEVQMLFEVHCLRHLGKEIQNNYLDGCHLEADEDGEYYVLLILKKPLPESITIPEEYRSLRVKTKVS